MPSQPIVRARRVLRMTGLTALMLTLTVLGQPDLWASRVLTRMRPSMEAVRQVPQSSAELQSSVTTGDRCPPSDREACSSRAPPPASPLVSFRMGADMEGESSAAAVSVFCFY